MNRSKFNPFISLLLSFLVCTHCFFVYAASETKSISFTKNIVVKKLKIGDVHAEPYTVAEKDNLWKILIDKYKIDEREFDFYNIISKYLNPELKNNTDTIIPDQMLLIPFKYVPAPEMTFMKSRATYEEILSTPFSNT